MEELKEKKCSKCGEVKPINEFYTDKSKRDGYKYGCKLCCNSQHINYSIKYQLNRRKNDPMYNTIHLIRERTRKAIKKYKSLSKESSTMKMLGCDKETLMNHLQATGILYDPNFDIYNYDSSLYHIDHIKTFADVSKGIYTLEEVCHYTNLQILSAEVNRYKSGNSW